MYPNFEYVRAEMTAARGDSVAAGRLYDTAAARYADRNDTDGASRSMLAASAAAASSGDLVTARARAHAASSLVETSGKASDANAAMVRMWATWQEGRVALVTGDTDHALASFGQARSAAPSIRCWVNCLPTSGRPAAVTAACQEGTAGQTCPLC
jgi:ATP/maltotriose-dependent transcriptional regulator MalT